MTRRDHAQLFGREIRDLCRRGEFDGPTAGVARGYVQANLVVLRSGQARDFEAFCRRNPKPCPLLEVLPPGRAQPLRTAGGADIRTDLPRYRVYRDGVCVDRTQAIGSHWDDRCVAFLIGCSFTFESALQDAGIPLRHIEERKNVPMYRTNLPCRAAGVFATNMIVSMRPMTLEQADLASRITARYPRMHGDPVHVSDPASIGVEDLGRPEFGDAVTIRRNEVPVFWACGVTPMAAIMSAGIDFAVTHEPGYMFVTDLSDLSMCDNPSD